MERKNNTGDHYQHEHHNSAGTEETHLRKESHGGWVCHRCGWTHPNPHPSAKQRRNHKKHCGKIEGFKLIDSGDTEKRGASSEEVSSDEEHKSTDHTEKEGKHITSHQHQHEQQPHPAGTGENHYTKEHRGWVCHRCGWTYPNPHPSAKHRKNHKKHCGNIEGFKLIGSRDTEIKGGSSDDESSDDEPSSTDHEKRSSLKENNVAAQKHASPSTPDCNSSNLDISSSEANVGAIQTLYVSDNATVKPPETTGIDANARNSIIFGESGKETLVESTITTAGLGIHGLNISETVESSKNLIGYDMLISEDKSNLFYKVRPDTEDNQNGSRSVEHQELPVKDHQLQNPGHIEAPRTFGKSASTPAHAAKEHNIGIGSMRVGIASILSFNGLNSGNLNPEVSSVEQIPASADTKIYELSQTNHQVNESKMQEILVSETKEDKMQNHVAIPSDLNEGLNIKLPLGTESQKDDPPSLTFEPETEKLLQCTSSTTAMDSTSLNNLKVKVIEGVIDSQEVERGISNKPENYENSAKSETCQSEYAVISDEKKNTAEHDMLLNPGDYVESKNISPSMHEYSERNLEEKLSNFENLHSDDMLHPEEEKEKIINQEAIKGPSSEIIESTSGQKLDEQAPNVVIPDQETSCTDNFLTEYSKEGDMKDDNPNCRTADSTPENIVMSTTNIARDPDTPVDEVDNENQDARKDPSSKGIESTSGQKSDEQASNVVIPDQETSGTDRFPTEYSKDGEKQQRECSNTSSSTIERDTKEYSSDSGMADSTPENIVMTATNIVRVADTPFNELANENQEAIKGPSSEGIESTSGQKLDEEASNIVILDQETSSADSFPTEYSKEGEKQQRECSSITSSNTIAIDMKDYNPECRTADSTPENIVIPATDIVRVADTPVNEVANENQEAINGPSSEGIESTSGQKLDEQASNVVILDEETRGMDSFPTEFSKEGEKQQRECSSITSSSTIEHIMKDYNPDCRTADSTPENIVMPATDMVRDADTLVNELANEKSVVAESHHPESIIYNHEQKSTVEQAISVNPAEYIESKEIPNLEKAKVMEEPCSGGIETTSDQKLISQASSKLVITDEAMSSVDNPPIKYSGLGDTQQNECNGPTNSSIIEPCVTDSDPDSKKENLMQGNIMLPDVDRDGHIDANINAQESLSEAAATEIVHANSAASEPVESNSRNTYSSSQDVACANFGAQLPEEELQYKHHEKGLEHSGVEQSNQFKVDNANYTSCSAATIADNSLQLNGSSTDGHYDSSKESMDDVHGSKTESLKTCEPALWEQLLESNAKELNNPEIYQDLENPQQSPDNPFIYGQSFSSKEEAHQTFHTEGGHGLISEQLKNNSTEVESALPLTNNRVEQSPITNVRYKGEGNVKALNLKEKTSVSHLEAPADMFEAPSFVTLVETGNHAKSWTSHHEIQPNADLAPGGSQNGGLSAEASELDSEGLERHHKPLRNLLAEENKRGTQDRSKQDLPLVKQPKTSSQNNIEGVHASTVHVTDEGGTSSVKLEIAQKDSYSSSKKILEKVWNSPARLPSLKVEKQKAKVKSAWSMCLCGSATN